MWEGEAEDEYGYQAITGTLAVVARGLGVAADPAEALRVAETWWRTRDQTPVTPSAPLPLATAGAP